MLSYSLNRTALSWLKWCLVFCLFFLNPSCDGFVSSEHFKQFHVPNLTFKQIAVTLRQRGFKVIEFRNEPPLVIKGDTAYAPEEVLPELLPFRERGETHSSKRLWTDKHGRAQVSYFYDTGTKADHGVFEKAVNSWSTTTCITFTKISDGVCARKTSDNGVCVGSFDGCWSMIGRIKEGYQKMSVEPGGCELFAAAHEFGHALGFFHMMARADRDNFITVNYENFGLVEAPTAGELENRMRHTWYQGARCDKSQTFQAMDIVPYDYRSIMQYAQSDFADEDRRMIFATRDAHYQYLLDYDRSGGYLQTHYDKYVINTAYKCDKKWEAHCRKSGKTPPKCKNNGYLKNDCKCACPTGFTGSSCQTKHGALFPILDRARAMIDVTRPGRVSLKGRGMHTNNLKYPLRRFIYYQYATIVIKGKSAATIASVRVYEPGDVAQSYTLKVGKIVSYFVNLDLNDCRYGLLFHWGKSDKGRMRTECFSTFVNNEPKENAVVLRSKDHTMDIAIIAKLGKLFSYAEFTKWMLEMLEFTVSFPKRPQSALQLLDKKGGSVVSFTTEPSLAEGAAGALLASAMSSPSGRAALAGVSVLLLLLITGGIAAGVCLWKRRNAEPESAAGSLKTGFVNTFKLSSDSSESAQSAASGSDSDA